MSFVYANLVPLDQDEKLKPGERIVIRFNWMQRGWYSRAAQWAALERELEGRKDFTVISYVNTDLYLDVEIAVISETIDQHSWGWGFLQPQQVVVTTAVFATALAIGASIISICVYLSIREAFRSPGPTSIPMKTMVSGIGAAGYAALIAIIYVVLKGVRVIR